MSQHVVIVANPGARGHERLDGAISVFRGFTRRVTTLEIGDEQGLGELLGSEPRPTLVAAGGDGTLDAVVARLRDRRMLTEVVLGLLPLGTGNDFARTLGIPLDPRLAAQVILGGTPRFLDLLVDDTGTIAINAVHAGVGGLAAARAASLKPWLGRIAYSLGAATAGARSRGWHVRVEVDGAPVMAGRALFVGLGNGSSIGGGTRLWPRARPDDGIVEVVVARAGGLVSRLRLAGNLRRGDLEKVSGVVQSRGRHVRIEGEPIPYNVDGEVGATARTRHWTVEHRAWRLITPPSGHRAR